MSISATEELLEDFRCGRMIILVDDEADDRGGDLLISATRADAEHINFMARHGRGLICLALTPQRCAQLCLTAMVPGAPSSRREFLASIEAARGVSTGISAADRAKTIAAAVAAEASPNDLVQPGHVFPLRARPGGVLNRAGHTEAGVDLARLAGHEPAAVLCQILDGDGAVACARELVNFARTHGLKMGTIAGLIEHRLQSESTVERVSEGRLPTRFGEFRLLAYHDGIEKRTHVALVKGEIRREQPTIVRVYVHAGPVQLLEDLKPDQLWPLDRSVARVAREKHGVVVVLDCPESPEAVIERIGHLHGPVGGIELSPRRRTREIRTVGAGSQILADLGVGRMRVLGRPQRVYSLSGFGLEIIDYISDEEQP